jgi:hypothetical protein
MWVRRQAVTTGHTGPEELEAALTGCDVVIIPAGVPRKPGMTRDDLFKINAGIVAGVVEGVAKYCPGAMINMISNPVRALAAPPFTPRGSASAVLSTRPWWLLHCSHRTAMRRGMVQSLPMPRCTATHAAKRLTPAKGGSLKGCVR